MHPIWLNRKRVQVRDNLYQFFRVFRSMLHSVDKWLWTDQLCIDQANLTERNAQVGIMGQIYKDAAETYMWLGVDPDRGQAALELERIVESLAQATERRLQAIWRSIAYSPACRSLKTLFDRKYWTRHWIFQEAVISSRRQLLYRHSTISWEAFEAAMKSFPQDWMKFFNARAAYSVFLAVQDYHSLGFSSSASSIEATDHETRLRNTCLTFARSSLCSDPRDKVYGIQSLMHADFSISVNYLLPAREVLVNWIVRYAEHTPRRIENILVLSQNCSLMSKAMRLALDKEHSERAFTDFVLKPDRVRSVERLRAELIRSVFDPEEWRWTVKLS